MRQSHTVQLSLCTNYMYIRLVAVKVPGAAAVQDERRVQVGEVEVHLHNLLRKRDCVQRHHV